nr:ribosome small subunit-dependent GTPase A [Eubacterium sp.]
MEREGKIIKGIAGFYYVNCETDNGMQLYECKAKGGFRKDKVKPLVGDNVVLQVTSEEKRLGNIQRILPRKNMLIRPEVANVDQAVVVFAMADPHPNLNLLDRFLVMMEMQDIETVICFNKQDIVSDEEEEQLVTIYEKCVNQVLSVSSKENVGIDKLYEVLDEKTTVLAGPSGVGKSSLLNQIYPEAASKTGQISEKIGRGKHTTRHSELYCIGEKTYLFDTPGFSSLKVPEMEKEQLKNYFTEFIPYEGACRFMGCTHTHEPDCRVKEALAQGDISSVRYENYVQMYEELAEWEKRRYN